MRNDLDPARGIVNGVATMLGLYAVVLIVLAVVWKFW